MSEIDNDLYDLPELAGDDPGEFPGTDEGQLNTTEYDISAEMEEEPAAAPESADFSETCEERLDITEDDLPEDTEDEATDAAGEEPDEKKPVRGKKKARRKLIILLAAALAVLALFLFMVPGGGLKKIVNNTRLMHAARVLKSDIKELGSNIRDQDAESAGITRRKMQQDITDVRDILSNPFWSSAGALPAAKSRLNDVNALLDIAEEADAKIIGPLISLMAECPLSELKTDKGLNDSAVLNYLKLVDSAIPEAKDLAVRMEPLDLEQLDSSLKKADAAMGDIIAALEAVEEADKTVIRPLISLMEESPVSEIKTDDGLNEDAIVKYIRLFEDSLPEGEKLLSSLKSLDLSKLLNKKETAKITEKLDLAGKLLDIAALADRTIISRALPVLEEYHISDLKKDGGLNIIIALKYLDLCEELLPGANELAESLRTIDLGEFDGSGKIAELMALFEDTVDLGNEAIRLLPIARGVIGDGSDRVLLLVAQNNSEIRSLGGFPGQVATITIKDGIMKLNEFGSCWKLFSKYPPKAARPTALERKIFYGMWISRDAEICPVFERVALIWAEAYGKKNNVHIDGVISATQLVFEKFLSFLGSIELSDGTVMTGDNAMRVLCHDLYWKYFTSEYSTSKANRITDRLFNEIASKTKDLAISEVKPSNLRNYYEALLDGMNDRSIQVWVRDEEVQQLIRDEGWNSHLNDDPENPEIAVYFSSNSGGSKNSWFLDVDAELSEPTVKADGTRSYEFKVTFTNTITEEEKETLTEWILGKAEGDVSGFIFLFGPAGGTITDYHATTNFKKTKWTYMELECYNTQARIKNSSPLVISCTITTAPGVETVPAIRLPNTLTRYR